MSKYFYSLVVLGIVLSCQPKNSASQAENTSTLQTEEPQLAYEADSIVVLIESEDKEVFFLYMDLFGNQYSLKKGENKVPVRVFLSEGTGHTYYPILSSEELLFKKNTQGIWVAYRTDGTEDPNKNFFAWYKTYFPDAEPNDLSTEALFMQPELVKNPERRAAAIEETTQQLLALFDQYSHDKALDPSYQQLWRTFLEYHVLARAMMGIAGRPQNFPRTYLEKAVRENWLPKFSNDDAILIPEYKSGAMRLSRLLTYLAAPKHFPDNTLTERYLATAENFSGATRDILLSKMLLDYKTLFPKTTSNEYKTIATRYLKDCQTSAYKEYISRSLRLNTSEQLLEYQVFSTQEEGLNFSSLVGLSTLTYVDFWASWCAPCRAEMPASKKLKQQYAGRGIQFLYLSLDKDIVAWERAMKQVGLSAEESYLLPSGGTSELTKQFDVKAIPRYVLLDQKGNILHADAPRPSDSTISDLFEKYLEALPAQ